MNLYLPNRYRRKRTVKRLKDATLMSVAAIFLLCLLPVLLLIAAMAFALMGAWWAARAARVPLVRLARRRRGLPRPAVTTARAMELALEEYRRRTGQEMAWNWEVTEHVDCFEVEVSTGTSDFPSHSVRIDCFTGETLACESYEALQLLRPAPQDDTLLRPAQSRREENREALLRPISGH